MSNNQDKYVSLMASFPRINSPFQEEPKPMSHLKLHRRLSCLTSKDRELLHAVEHCVAYAPYSVDVSDMQNWAYQSKQEFEYLHNIDLRIVLESIFNLRVVVRALKYKNQDLPNTVIDHWAFGRFSKRVKLDWHKPLFGFANVIPWIKEAEQMIEKQDTLDLEHLMIAQEFLILKRAASKHCFSIEAVILYFLKWRLFTYVAKINGEEALEHFQKHVDLILENNGVSQCQTA